MRARDGAKIGAAGSDDAVRVVGLEDRADGDRRDARLVPDPIGERRLVHPSVDRPGIGHDLARTSNPSCPRPQP